MKQGDGTEHELNLLLEDYGKSSRQWWETVHSKAHSPPNVILRDGNSRNPRNAKADRLTIILLLEDYPSRAERWLSQFSSAKVLRDRGRQRRPVTFRRHALTLRPAFGGLLSGSTVLAPASGKFPKDFRLQWASRPENESGACPTTSGFRRGAGYHCQGRGSRVGSGKASLLSGASSRRADFPPRTGAERLLR